MLYALPLLKRLVAFPDILYQSNIILPQSLCSLDLGITGVEGVNHWCQGCQSDPELA